MKQQTFDAGRVSSVSDGIFAIAMTLLVLDLKLPDLSPEGPPIDFAAVVVGQIPRFISWLLSFAILCRLWIIHHALLAEADTHSRRFIWWNFIFLGAVSLLPFPTSLMAEHHDQAWAVVVFSATLATGGAALWVMTGIRTERAGSGRAPVIWLFGTATASALTAFVSPRWGALLWIVFPSCAGLVRWLESRSDRGNEESDEQG